MTWATLKSIVDRKLRADKIDENIDIMCINILTCEPEQVVVSVFENKLFVADNKEE